MNQKKLIVLFYLNKAKMNQKGTCPLYCRITFLKKRKQFSTGLFLSPSTWKAKTQFVLPVEPKNEYINAQMAIITAKTNTHLTNRNLIKIKDSLS